MPAAVGEAVQSYPRGRAGEQGPVTGLAIVREMLQVVEQLKHDAEAKREIRLVAAEPAAHEPAVGQDRRTALLDTDQEKVRVVWSASRLLLQALDLSGMDREQTLIDFGKLRPRVFGFIASGAKAAPGTAFPGSRGKVHA